MEYGYQYFIPDTTNERLNFIPKDKNYYDIDIKDPECDEKLKYVAALSMSYKIPTPGEDIASSNLKDLIFIVKKDGSSSTDENMICAFNHREIFNTPTIYSPRAFEFQNDLSYGFEQIKVTKTYGKFDSQINVKWIKTNTFIPMSIRRDFSNRHNVEIWN